MTFIKAIKYKNYKCLQNTKLNNLGLPRTSKPGSGLNILIGNNNSGKTALVSVLTKLKPGSMISDEDKYQGKDVVVDITDSAGKTKRIKNIRDGCHIDIGNQGDSALSNSDIDFIKDNRVWVSNFNNEMDYENYRNNYNFIRSNIDSHLPRVLSHIEKNDKTKKIKINRMLKQIVPDFTDWTIRNSSKQGSYISYRLSNGQSLDIDFSLGSGILNLFKIILSLVQDKPIVVIDEPEAFLHPSAQEELLRLLLDASRKKQIFITTHSPYMFKGSVGAGANLFVVTVNTSGMRNIINANTNGWNLFSKYSPTWGEINWFAYGLPTVEFHNELYGFVQAKAIAIDPKYETEKNFDSYLNANGLSYSEKWTREKAGAIHPDPQYQNYDVTLQTFIRNKIHHPENKTMQRRQYTPSQLKQSITAMIGLLK